MISQLIVMNNFDDNINYKYGFESITNESFTEAFAIYKEITGAFEPVLFLFSYIANDILSYELLILMINVMFLLSFYAVLRKYFVNNYPLIFAVFVPTNLYVTVLLSDVHRLKLALIFYFTHLIVEGKFKYILFILSLVSHFQMAILGLYKILPMIISSFNNKRKFLFLLKITLLLGAIIPLLFHAVDGLFYYTHYNVINKVLYYYDGNTAFNYYAAFMFSIYGLYGLYLYYFQLFDVFNRLWIVVLVTFIISLVLNFYRINLLVFAYIYAIELNRLFERKNYAILPALGFLLYNIYHLLFFLFDGLSFK